MEYRQVLHNLTWAINFLMIDGMRESGRRDAGEGDLQDVCSRLLLRPSATLIWLRLDGPDAVWLSFSQTFVCCRDFSWKEGSLRTEGGSHSWQVDGSIKK
ncbi:hypothetical protein PVAP13_3NG056268 [Panicum virgatum]|uniref:Uncharacterized protein n=1 Tax=Panicum virgatum TaxID=38727 RepID=A0A8T0TYS3_PANVG|nr:hypothetical protein PVAP13_3NG056268 [Panicum virgatum]